MQEANQDPEMRISLVLCDMVERRLIRGMKNSNSTYGCEICKAAGCNKHWPPETQGHPYRTEEESRMFARYFPTYWTKTCDKPATNVFQGTNNCI